MEEQKERCDTPPINEELEEYNELVEYFESMCPELANKLPIFIATPQKNKSDKDIDVEFKSA